MKSIVQSNVEARVRQEAEKHTIMDTYGPLVGWMKVLADWLLAPAGAVLDGLVLFGIFFLSLKNVPLAAVLAGIAAVAIQFLYGKPAAVAASTAFSGRYDNPGEQRLMWAMSFITVLGLGASLILSFQSGKLVEAVAERIYTQEPDTAINARFDRLLDDVRKQYRDDREAIESQVSALQADKVMYQGQWSVRERSSRQASKLATGLATLRQQLATQEQQLATERQHALQQLETRNAGTAGAFAARVADGGATLKGINIGFNVVRLAIILIFIYFIVVASEQPAEQQKAATRVGNTATEPETAYHNQRPAEVPAQPARAVVKPFGGMLPNMATDTATLPENTATLPATRVANTATQQEQPAQVTIIQGRPVMAWKYSSKPETANLTLAEVKKYLGILSRRKATKNNLAQVAELNRMKSELEKAGA